MSDAVLQILALDSSATGIGQEKITKIVIRT